MNESDQSQNRSDPSGPAEWFDQSLDWDARVRRDIPVLIDVLGPPSSGGVLDAGCGPGRHALALAQRGYRVVGTDPDEAMIDLARRTAGDASVEVEFTPASFATMHAQVGGGFDGIYCLGNSLAAAGTKDAVREAVNEFAQCLRTGGRLLLDCLNFTPMRPDVAGAGGPTMTVVGGLGSAPPPDFQLGGETVHVSKITIREDADQPPRSSQGRLYPLTILELQGWCDAAGIRIDERWGSFAREPFDVGASMDLLVVGTRL